MNVHKGKGKSFVLKSFSINGKDFSTIGKNGAGGIKKVH